MEVRRRWGCVYKGGKFKVIKEVIKGVKALVLFDGIVGFCLMGLRMESVTLTTPMGRGQLGNQRRTMGRWEMSGKFKAVLVNGLGCLGSQMGRTVRPRRAKTVIYYRHHKTKINLKHHLAHILTG